MFGIRARLVAFAFLFVLLVVGAISLTSLLHTRLWVRDTYEGECRAVASLLAEQVADPLYTLDVSGVRSALRHAGVNRALQRVVVTDSTGVALADNSLENALRDSRPSQPFDRRTLSSGAWIAEVDGESLRVGGPVRMPDGTRVGSLLASFSLEPATALLQEVVRGRLLIGVVCLVLGVLLAFFVSKGLTRPIHDLVQATQAVAEGNFAARVPARRRDELGRLAGSVNRMAESLERTTVTKADLDRILESMADPLIVLDEAGRMRTVNAAVERLLAYRREDLVGRSIEVLLEGSPWGTGGLAGAGSRLEVRDVEVNLLALDGARIPVSFSASPLGGGSVAPAGVVCVARDVREGKRAQRALAESEARFRSIFERVSLGAVLVSPGGQVIRANAAYGRLVGAPEAELAGRSVAEWTHPEDRAETARLLRELGEGKRRSVDFEKRYVRKDGSVVWARVSSTSLLGAHGRPEYYVALVQDVSERRRAEAALSGARDEALAHARLKSEFLANMSHEIRTPLNGVLGFVELLEGTRLDPTQREYLATLRGSAEGLLRILNDILDFSKIEAGKLDLETVDFDPLELLEEVGELLAPRAEGKGLDLLVASSPPGPCRLRGDPARLRQVLLNLAGNAVKFTERGEVSLRAEVAGGERPDVRLEVRDTGIGIPADRLDRLFQPFTQVDGSNTRRHGGTGLGLAIAKRLVEQMGGRIEVGSAPGQGSTFAVTLALERAPEAPPERELEAVRGRSVLVVEDNASARGALVALLRSFGCAPGVAVGTADARRNLEEAERQGRAIDVGLVGEGLLGPGDSLLSASKGTQWIRMVRRRAAAAGTGPAEAETLRLARPVRRGALLRALAEACSGREAVPDRAGEETFPDERPGRRGVRVLLVEDDPVNQKVALALLRRLGAEAELAAEGRAAVAAVARTPYDLVLMDVQMPGMDGFEATAAIRTCEGAGRRTPIVAMTARAMKGDRERCLAAGMDDYLTKPVRAKDLEALLVRWTPEPSTPAQLAPARPSDDLPPVPS
ncbi:MAG TPA: PAS domain S-box protein [Planctomycetota bacterium]|jgi:PAS domain S-box-containing protein|nr:PAS domain S-box protein [Planctomycetota bacterium]